MKRVLIFIGLKVAEVAGVVAVAAACYIIGRCTIFHGYPPEGAVDVFMCALCGFGVCLFCITIVDLLLVVIAANWQWAGRLAKKKESE